MMMMMVVVVVVAAVIIRNLPRWDSLIFSSVCFYFTYQKSVHLNFTSFYITLIQLHLHTSVYGGNRLTEEKNPS
jgi:hypothetical protein